MNISRRIRGIALPPRDVTGYDSVHVEPPAIAAVTEKSDIHQEPVAGLTRSDRQVLALLFRGNGITQGALVDATDLTQQSISRIASKLSDLGLVHSRERAAAGKRGYPSAGLTLNPDYAVSIGIALMADAISLTMIDFTGRVRAERKTSLIAMPRARVLEWAARAIPEVSAEVPGVGQISGCGISLPGSFIGNSVGFNTPHYLEDWAAIDVEQVFAERLGLPVWAENDGNAAALGESMVGVGRWARSFAYLYIGAGVGGGLVLNGELWRGRFGNAGEFAGGLPSGIYPFPNLELLRQLVAKDGQVFATVEEMIANWDEGWPAIDDWIARVRDSFSIIASNATAILDLDAVVLGGRMPKSLAERLIPRIELYDQRRRAVARPTAVIVPAEAPGNAAALGAAMLPLKHKFFA